jgi:adenosylhomocysteine nucleosidase
MDGKWSRIFQIGVICLLGKEREDCLLKAFLLYSKTPSPYAWIAMLLIAAAMGAELQTAMVHCRGQIVIAHRSLSLRQATRNDKPIVFLKTGVGPRRSAESLEEALKVVDASHILVIGYAGALDPDLKLGDLVAVRNALAFSLDKANPTWDNVQLDGKYELRQSEELAHLAKSLGLRACTGDSLTSSYVLGDPAHKRLLHEKFHASIVDMETAALARVAAAKDVPLYCVRVISDEAGDTFLAPFSHDPSTNIAARAGKLLSNGMVQTYRDWKLHTLVANKSLTHFLSHYL